jgi:hypothetical protein
MQIAGECSAFPLFVPVSSVAKLLGMNPYESVDDAISQTVSRNTRTFVWRDAQDDTFVDDKLHLALAVASDETLDQVVQLSGLNREQALVRGLMAYLYSLMDKAVIIQKAIPGSVASEYDIVQHIESIGRHQTMILARALEIDTSPATRNGTGYDGVKAIIVDRIEDIRAYNAKISRTFGSRTQATDLEIDVRIEIASSEEPTFDGAIGKIAEKFGTTLENVLRAGSRQILGNAIKRDPGVAKTVPPELKRAAVSEANCSVGKRMEKRDVDALEEDTGHRIGARNSAMKYGRVYATSNVAVDIGGRVDGTSSDESGTYIVESKRRAERFLGVPEYERVQVELYMRLFGTNRCLHVETLGEDQRQRWLSPDDVLLASIVQGLRDVACSRILPRCMPTVGARTIANAFTRFRTGHVENPQFDMEAPADELRGLWVEEGVIDAGDRCG